MDKIIIKGLEIYAFHGVNAEEKEKGQKFIIDVTLHVSLRRAGETDDVEDTVSYSDVTKTILKVVKENTYNLLERVATRIIQQLFIDFFEINSVDITIKKPNAPVSADFEYMAVNISRDRNDFYDRSGVGIWNKLKQ